MDIFVTFNNRQLIKGEIESESNVESVGVHANGFNTDDVANALMTVIDCLTIEPIDVVYWMIQDLPNKEQKDIKRSIVCKVGNDEDEVKIAVEAIGRLNRDEQEQIARNILSRFWSDIADSACAASASEETNEPL